MRTITTDTSRTLFRDERAVTTVYGNIALKIKYAPSNTTKYGEHDKVQRFVPKVFYTTSSVTIGK